MKHFSKALMRSALALLMFFTTTVSVWADGLSGTGTPDAPFIVASAQDWQTLADSVSSGKSYYEKYISLTADLSGITTMIGTEEHPFNGQFYGNGHTINLNLTGTGDYTAPFRYAQDAFIVSLNTTGTVDSKDYMYAAGIVGYADSVLISACRSSVTIKSSIDGDGSHGGLAAISNRFFLIHNSLFDGEIDAPSADFCGGFLGWKQDGEAYFLNCLMAGTMSCLNYNSGTFTTYCYSGLYFISSYYKTGIGTTQGTKTDATGSELLALLNKGWQIKNNEVVPKTDINDLEMSVFALDQEYYIYSGKPIEPEYVLYHLYYLKLEAGKHFTVSFTDSLGNPVAEVINRGKYTITFTGNEQEGLHGSFSYPIYVIGLRKDSDGKYLIENADDWTAFAEAVNEREINYSGDIIKLTDDITVNCMVGTIDNSFSGAFDGCGHTINLEIPDHGTYIAPFFFVKNAEINRLNVTGTFNNYTAIAISGFVAFVTGQLRMFSCRSSINITNTSLAKDTAIYNGMVLGVTAKVEMTNCLFDGKIQSPVKTVGAGFLYASNGTSTLNNCLMTGSLECDTKESGVFCNLPDDIILNNCYHNTDFSLTQGTQTSATGEELKALLGNGWVVSNGDVIPNINDKDLNIATVIGLDRYHHYTGLPLEINCRLLTCSFDTLSDNDYTLVFRNGNDQIVNEIIQEGDYTATFTGKGQYTGSLSFSFTVKDYPMGMDIDYHCKEGEDGFYYVKIPTKDTLRVTLPDGGIKKFKVNNAEKNSGFNSSVILSAPEGYIYKINGTFKPAIIGFDLLKICNVTENNEYEKIFYRAAGNLSTSSPKDTIPSIINLYSSGNSLYINYYALYDTEKGLDLTISLIKLSETALQDVIIETCPNGIIESDVSSAHLKSVVTLTATPDPGYCLDSISIIDKNGHKIKMQGGRWYNNVATFQMPDTAIIVKAHFISKNDEGLYVNMPYKAGKKLASDTITLTDASIMSFKVYDNGGKNGEYYEDNDSYLALHAPEGYIFKLTGTLKTEQSSDPDDPYDYVCVYDGCSTDSPKLTDKLFCTENCPILDIGTIYSTGRDMMILFSSDIYKIDEGLDFTVTLVPADAPTIVKSLSATTDEQNLYLPDGRQHQGAPTPGILYLQPGRKIILLP